MIIGVTLLHQGVVAFADDLARFIVDNYGANRATALFISLARQQHANAHEILIAQAGEKPRIDNRRQTFGRQMCNGDQNLVSRRRSFRNQTVHGDPLFSPAQSLVPPADDDMEGKRRRVLC
jgi:hypothetical protein